VTLTPAAVAKVMELLELEAGEGLRLRIAVQPGGCSGLRYQLFFDQRSFEGDYVARLGDADEPASEPAPGYDSGYESGSDE
jgi:Fe-S cluster assembly iron-binding protein IscA